LVFAKLFLRRPVSREGLVLEIALRQLGLLQRALQNSPPEITGTLKEMLTGDANSFPPPFVC